MASAPILPRGIGTNRRGFNAFIAKIAKYYPTAYRDAYYKEFTILLTDIIEHTPIDTGYAAGVTENLVGSQKRKPYAGHKASGLPMSNDPGGSGWQMDIKKDTLKEVNTSIVNPMWGSYLKFLEYGINQPLPPAKSHFVFNAWKRHLKRRDNIRKEVARGRR